MSGLHQHPELCKLHFFLIGSQGVEFSLKNPNPLHREHLYQGQPLRSGLRLLYHREFVDYMPDAPGVHLEPCDLALTTFEDEHGHIVLQFSLDNDDIKALRHYVGDVLKESNTRGFDSSYIKNFGRKNSLLLMANCTLNEKQRMWIKTLMLILRFPTEDEQVIGREERHDETVNQMLSSSTT